MANYVPLARKVLDHVLDSLELLTILRMPICMRVDNHSFSGPERVPGGPEAEEEGQDQGEAAQLPRAQGRRVASDRVTNLDGNMTDRMSDSIRERQ